MFDERIIGHWQPDDEDHFDFESPPEPLPKYERWKPGIPKNIVDSEQAWKKIWHEHVDTQRGKDRYFQEDDEYPYRILREPIHRAALIEATKKLIEKITKDQIDAVIFLDKSARPLNTLLRTQMRVEQPEADLPKMYFLNVGQEKTMEESDITWREMLLWNAQPEPKLETSEIEKATAEEIQKTYFPNNPDIFEQMRKTFSTDSGQSVFAGKNVLVVDDYQHSGRSLALAKRITELTFGSQAKKVEGHYFATESWLANSRRRAKKLEDYPGMPWSHGVQYYYDQNEVPIAGVAGVVDSEPEGFQAEATPTDENNPWFREIHQALVGEAKSKYRTQTRFKPNSLDSAHESLDKYKQFRSEISGQAQEICDQVVHHIRLRLGIYDQIKDGLEPDFFPKLIRELFRTDPVKLWNNANSKASRKIRSSDYTGESIRIVTSRLEETGQISEEEEDRLLEIIDWPARLSEGAVNSDLLNSYNERLNAKRNAFRLRDELRRIVLFHYFYGIRYGQNGEMISDDPDRIRNPYYEDDYVEPNITQVLKRYFPNREHIKDFLEPQS